MFRQSDLEFVSRERMRPSLWHYMHHRGVGMVKHGLADLDSAHGSDFILDTNIWISMHQLQILDEHDPRAKQTARLGHSPDQLI